MHPNPSAVPNNGGDDSLTLECYGAGYALLRPETSLSRLQRFARRFAAATRPTPRYVLTDMGRRELAMARLLEPRPTVAEIAACGAARFQGRCSASGAGGACPFSATSARGLRGVGSRATCP